MRIATTTGSDVTGQFVAIQIGDYIIKGRRNLVKVIIRVAYRENNQEVPKSYLEDYLKAKPTVLITDNRVIRLEAVKVGVTTVMTSIIKQVLIAQRR